MSLKKQTTFCWQAGYLRMADGGDGDEGCEGGVASTSSGHHPEITTYQVSFISDLAISWSARVAKS